MTRLLIIAFCAAPGLYSQVNDWNALKSLDPGKSISVLTHGRRDCNLLRVTDTELVCDYHAVDVVRTVTFSRPDVREVRAEEPEHNHAVAGAAVGAVIGGLAGLGIASRSNDTESRVVGSVVGFPVGGLVGAIVGRHQHRHGQMIYRKP